MLDSQLREMYQEVILEHSRTPRHYDVLQPPCNHAKGNNPLCGDRIEIYVQEEQQKLSRLSFQGQGCAICMASASLMVQALHQQPTELFHTLFKQFQHEITKPLHEPIVPGSLGKLQVILGVREFPMRVKCATLAWHTLHNALEANSQIATTE